MVQLNVYRDVSSLAPNPLGGEPSDYAKTQDICNSNIAIARFIDFCEQTALGGRDVFLCQNLKA